MVWVAVGTLGVFFIVNGVLMAVIAGSAWWLLSVPIGLALFVVFIWVVEIDRAGRFAKRPS
jgi:hypothetical protein